MEETKKVVMRSRCRVRELDTETKRGFADAGETISLPVSVANAFVGMKKAVFADSKDAKQVIENADKAKKAKEKADKQGK